MCGQTGIQGLRHKYHGSRSLCFYTRARYRYGLYLKSWGGLEREWILVPRLPVEVLHHRRMMMLIAGTEALGRNWPQCIFVHHKSHWHHMRSNPGPRGKKPTINSLSYDSANTWYLHMSFKGFHFGAGLRWLQFHSYALFHRITLENRTLMKVTCDSPKICSYLVFVYIFKILRFLTERRVK
jgi:hypothetical protein